MRWGLWAVGAAAGCLVYLSCRRAMGRKQGEVTVGWLQEVIHTANQKHVGFRVLGLDGALVWEVAEPNGKIVAKGGAQGGEVLYVDVSRYGFGVFTVRVFVKEGEGAVAEAEIKKVLRPINQELPVRPLSELKSWHNEEWAVLSAEEPGLVPRKVTSAQLAAHGPASRTKWVAVSGVVYDVTKFVEFHPGGRRVLDMTSSGVDATGAFTRIHPNVDVAGILEKFVVGDLVKE